MNISADTSLIFNMKPNAHRITSDDEAIAIARDLAVEFQVGAAERDRERILPVAELDRFSASGLWGMTVPRAYGGPDVSFATVATVISIISEADPSIGQIPHSHLAAMDTIRVTGSDEQKKLWFERSLQGYRLGNALSEAKGRHVGDFQTRFVPRGDGFVVNGEKFYATGALFAHYYHIGALDNEGRLNLAIAARGAPGLVITDDWSGFGQRTTASGSVSIENVYVGPEAVIPAYKARHSASSVGCVSQLIQAAIDAGIARAALADTIRFVKELSRPWIDSGQQRASDDLFIIRDVAELEIKIHAAEAMMERAGLAIDKIRDNPTDDELSEATIQVAEAKMLTTEIALLSANKLHELAGTRSTLGAYNLDRHWRNARAHTLHDPVRWKVFHIGNYLLNDVAPPRHTWS